MGKGEGHSWAEEATHQGSPGELGDGAPHRIASHRIVDEEESEVPLFE